MEKFKNENLIDRLIRFFAGEVFLLLAYFWLGGAMSTIFWVLGIVMIATALTGFCGLYKLFNVNTQKKYPVTLKKPIIYISFLVLILFPIIGGYYSNFFTRKLFLEDYNAMNNYYKQLLFNTGQDKRPESIDNYQKLTVEFAKFKNKYSNYKPAVIKSDKNFNSDLNKVQNIIDIAQTQVSDGDLPSVHKNLEEIRPTFQAMLKRNGFSMLAVYLVDFHDAMEKVIEAADDKNAQGVINVYAEVNDKLMTVEEAANDDEIKAIRDNFEAVTQLARDGKSEELSKKAAELKSSFIKVYLKRG